MQALAVTSERIRHASIEASDANRRKLHESRDMAVGLRTYDPVHWTIDEIFQLSLSLSVCQTIPHFRKNRCEKIRLQCQDRMKFKIYV